MGNLAEFKGALTRSLPAMAQRLPKHVSVDRMAKIATTAVLKTPKLLEYTEQSLFLSIMQACELGLEPGGALGEGYLIPYGNTCQFIPGYRGLITLARRSGQIVSIEAHAVYSDDEFDFAFGLEPRLLHRPNLKREKEVTPNDIVAFYAVARLKDGGTQCEVMTRAEVDAIRKRSRAAGSGPWVTDYAEMGKKTVIRRLFKTLPVSVELATALELQAQSEKGEFDPTMEVMEEGAEKVASLQDIANDAARTRGGANDG